MFCSGLNRAVHPERFIFANQIGYRGGHHTHFIGRHTTTRFTGQQGLREYSDDGCRKLRADLLLLIGRKGINNPVHRSLGSGGMQCAKHHVPGFGGADCRLNRFQIAHFTD